MKPFNHAKVNEALISIQLELKEASEFRQAEVIDRLRLLVNPDPDFAITLATLAGVIA